MDVIVNVIFWFVVLVFLKSVSRRNAKRKRIDEAYRWKQPQIHGERKFATRSQLYKKGLL